MGCLDVLRIVLAVINILVNGIGFLYGLALVVQGIAGLLIFNSLELVVDTEHLLFYNLVFSLYTTAGFLLILFSIAAAVGSIMACFPNSRGIKMFAAALLVIDLIALILVFILGVAGVIYVYVSRDTITDTFVSAINSAVNESYSLIPNQTHVFMSYLQRYLTCCGINGPQDFNTYPNITTLPDGCCATGTTCTPATADTTVGCGEILKGILVEYYNVIGGVGIFQLVSIFLLILLETVLIILVVRKETDIYK